MKYTNVFGYYIHSEKRGLILRRSANTKLINHIWTDKVDTIYDKLVTYATYKKNLKKLIKKHNKPKLKK